MYYYMHYSSKNNIIYNISKDIKNNIFNNKYELRSIKEYFTISKYIKSNYSNINIYVCSKTEKNITTYYCYIGKKQNYNIFSKAITFFSFDW